MTTLDLSLCWQRYQRTFFYCALVVLLSYGPELFDFTFATDYYFSELLQYPGAFGNDGRWLGAFIYYGVLGGKSNPFLFKLLFFASQFLIVVLISDLFGVAKTVQRTVVFTILAIHPYLLSLHSFNNTLPLYALGNLLSVLGVYVILKHRSPTAFAVSVLSIAGALASWQMGLNYGATLFLFFLIYSILSEPGLSLRSTAYYGQCRQLKPPACTRGGIRV